MSINSDAPPPEEAPLRQRLLTLMPASLDDGNRAHEHPRAS